MTNFQTKVFKTLFFFLILFSPLTIHCQEISKPPAKNIIGILVDAEDNPIEYANVVLYKSADSALITGVITNANGRFELCNIKQGNYFLVTKSIGYKDKTVPNIIFPAKASSLLLDTIKMGTNSKQLDEVVIQGNSKAVEYKLEKKILVVGKDIDAGVGNAIDILEKAPSVKVDMDGAISLRGNSNVTILVDGRPQTVGGNSALSSIPASSMERIEIITNPSAKYQSEGTAGIINIILKKNKKDVVSASAIVKAGTGDKYSGNVNAFYSKSKYEGNIQMIYDHMSHYNCSYRTRKFTFPDSVVNFRDDYKNRFYTDIDNSISAGNGLNFKNLSVFLNVKYGLYEYYTYKQGIQKRWDDTQSGALNLYNEVERSIRWNYFENDLSIKLKSDNERHKADIDLYNSYEYGRNNYESFSYPVNDAQIKSGDNAKILTRQDGTYHYYQGTIDYAFSIDSGNRIESGVFLKYMNNPTINKKGNFDFLTRNWLMDYSLQYNVDVNHSIDAAYLNYMGKFHRLEVQAGLRCEVENRDIHVSSIDSSFIFHSIDLFPSFSASYKMNKNTNLIVSYSKRKQVPRPWQIVPFTIPDDNYINNVGNASLKPEYTVKYDAGLHFDLKKYSGSFTFFYSDAKDETWLLQSATNDFNQNSKYCNVPTHISQGIEVENKFAASKYLRTNINGSVFLNHYKGEYNSIYFDNKNIAWNCTFIVDFTLSKTTKFQIFNAFYSDYATLQGRNKAFFYTNLSFNQSFYDKRTTLSLKTNDIFNTRQKNGNIRVWSGYEGEYSNWEKQYLLLSLSYNFNKYKSKLKTTSTERGAL